MLLVSNPSTCKTGPRYLGPAVPQLAFKEVRYEVLVLPWEWDSHWEPLLWV